MTQQFDWTNDPSVICRSCGGLAVTGMSRCYPCLRLHFPESADMLDARDREEAELYEEPEYEPDTEAY